MKIKLRENEYGEARGQALGVTTGGCGCCEGEELYYKKDAALQAIQEEEDDLKDDLKQLRKLRRTVKKWKS